MYYFSEEDLNLNDIVTNWLEKQPKENVQISSYLINEYFFKGINTKYFIFFIFQLL